MSENEMKYSVPHDILVCYDEFRVHGIQLSLVMHRFPPLEDQEISEEMIDFVAELDQEIADTPVRKMSFIGDGTFRGTDIYDEKQCERT